MKRIRDLSDDLVVTWWANAAAGTEYAVIARLSMLHTVPISEATEPKARRDLKRRLRRRRLVPTHRAPTPSDYERGKERWRHEIYHRELI